MSSRDLLLDSRYEDFVERYAFDPLKFAVEVCGMQPSADQEDLLMEMIEETAKVTVVSGTGTGKTATFARIVLWHLLCHPYAYYEGKVEIGSNTFIGAPVIKQVAEGVWKELADAKLAISQEPHAWILDYIEFTKTRVYVKGYPEQWFVSQVAMAAGQSISVAGKHRYWQLIVVDEAAGVSDEHFNVINATQTSPGNRTLLASQGARNAGFFYDTHHTLSTSKGGSWASLCFDSENSPFVTSKWLLEREIESGGRNSVEYLIRVKGKFAASTSDMLLTREEMEAVFAPRKHPLIGEHEPYGWVFLGDVAMGEYRDDSVIWVAKVIGYGDFGPEARRVEYVAIPVAGNDINPIDYAGQANDLVKRSDNGTLYLDNGGNGAVVCKLIERAGGVVNKVDWGKPCFSREYQARYFNLRACAMVRFRDAIRQGRVAFPQGIPQRLREKIIDQGARLPFHFSESGGLRYVMMRKEDMREEGIKSPDYMDGASFAFLEGAAYTPHSGTSAEHGPAGGVRAAAERIRAAMAGG